MIFEHLVDFHYAADVADPPPAHFNKMMLEIIAHEDELHEDEGHWLHGNGLYDRYLPLYRVSVQAWEFTLKIICRNIRFEELPAEE